MPYTKNTVNLSRLDTIVHYLKDKGYKPKIVMLGKIQGRGLNDLIPYTTNKKLYFMRKLEYLDKIMVEKFIGTNDEELDDYIFSYEFQEGKFPKDWVTVMYK